uniref:MIF4G domain-containing protein n=1 Tax=viral metagenome TaxID=1070528 RepID=A0A6C0F262_9ZZZZ
MTTYYTISDFTTKVYDGCKLKLPEDVAKILTLLSDSITATDSAGDNVGVNKKPVQKNNNRQYPQKVEDWSAVRSHKVTKIAEVKEGTEKTIKDIRIALNKFSNKNADTQHQTIVELINQVISESKEVEEDTKKVINIIFDIVSSNVFYSALYAKLYKDLIVMFPAFGEKLTDIITKYKDSFNQIRIVDPNTDYDGFCESVKNNDLRRAMTTFIINLMKNDAMPEIDVLDIIIYLEELVMKFAEESDKSGVIEEITENIFILITENKKTLYKSDIWANVIIPNIHTISKLRKTDAAKYKSMTSRSTFKYMDIIDDLNKK